MAGTGATLPSRQAGRIRGGGSARLTRPEAQFLVCQVGLDQVAVGPPLNSTQQVAVGYLDRTAYAVDLKHVRMLNDDRAQARLRVCQTGSPCDYRHYDRPILRICQFHAQVRGEYITAGSLEYLPVGGIGDRDGLSLSLASPVFG